MQLSVVLAEAIRARVLEDDGTVLRFRHDLIRESIYADLPASVLRGLHREAGQRLARSGAPALQVAEHLARGAVQGDADAIGWLTRAAREEGARSPDVAADLVERAAALMDRADPGRDRLLAERASSLMLAGRIADAAAACRVVLGRDHDRSVAGPVRICLGHVLLAQGQVSDAVRELERAGASPVLTGAERAEAWAWAGNARLALGDLDGASAAAEEARSAAVSADDHLSASVGMATLALVSEFRDRLRDALQIIDEAVRLADLSPGRLGHRYPVRVIQGHILIEFDRLEEARSALGTGMRISEDLGVRWPLPTYQVFLSSERMIAGEWDDAVAELEAGFALAEEIGETYSRAYAHGVLSLISFHRNDLSRAREAAIAASRDLAGWSPGFGTRWAVWPQSLMLEAGGEARQALASLAGAWDQCASSGLALEYPAVGADLVRLALAAGDIERARAVSAAVTEVASCNDVPCMNGAALHCTGLTENNAEILQSAASAYARGSRPLGLALACEDAGAAFARRGQLDRARPLLDKAISIYERLDAARDLARAEAVLREAGIRPGRRVTRGRPQFGWDSLTPAERTIACVSANSAAEPVSAAAAALAASIARSALMAIATVPKLSLPPAGIWCRRIRPVAARAHPQHRQAPPEQREGTAGRWGWRQVGKVWRSRRRRLLWHQGFLLAGGLLGRPGRVGTRRASCPARMLPGSHAWAQRPQPPAARTLRQAPSLTPGQRPLPFRGMAFDDLRVPRRPAGDHGWAKKDWICGATTSGLPPRLAGPTSLEPP